MKGFKACLRAIVAFLLALTFLAGNTGVAYAGRGELQPGDILLAANVYDDDEEAQPNYSGYFWEHAAIYVGQGRVVESIAKEYGSPRPGTRLVSLEKFLKRWNTVEVKRFTREPSYWQRRVFLRNQITRPQVIQAAIAYALKQAEKQIPYDWKANKYDESALYCSELVWHAFYEVVSIDLDSDGGINVPPDDLYWSPLLFTVTIDWEKPDRRPVENPD